MNSLFEIKLSKEDNLLKRFEEIHNYIYANDGLSPQQTLEEFVKILFIKISDENVKTNQFSISAEEWDLIKSGKTNIDFTNRISNLFEKTKQAFIDIFENDDRIKLSAIALGFTINKLQSISLLDSSQDAKGLAFQKFLSHHEKDGRGQFFTPEPVIEFCVEMTQPKPNETIIDPACGSGGFLMSALKYLQKNYSELKTSEIVSQHLFGLDINKSIARIAKMKLLLESNKKINVLCINSLEDIDAIKFSIAQKDGFDVVFTNPPFGAKITNTTTLSKFDLGHKWSNYEKGFHKTKTVYPNQNAEILFIERCIQLLKEGGRMAIVLPNGNFENPSLEYLRYYIKLKTKILAIVNLPQETFIPYGTGVKTSILFLEKDSSTLNKQYSIFFGRVTKLGYQGNKNGTPLYQKDKFGQTIKDSKGQQILDEDFSVIIDAFKKFQNGKEIVSDNAFSINYNELNGRFDFDFYSPENRKMFTNLENVKTVRLGDICEIVKIKSRKLKDQKLTVEYVELSDINTHSYEIINSTTYQVHELPSRASYELLEDDIITAIAGNSVGTRKHATAIVTKEFEGSICTNGFRVLRNFKIDSYYMLYFLKSEVFLKQMFMYRTGAAIPNVSDNDLLNIIIHLPNKTIIDEISIKMKRAFELRQESRKQIESIHLELA
ncbi:MAG: N-6 DNA methylase [Ignavibacteria bacterium]|jgi:type I restriction enzyme M protein|nr:N-6 DNA methylase [Ignavibacteria bacterium]